MSRGEPDPVTLRRLLPTPKAWERVSPRDKPRLQSKEVNLEARMDRPTRAYDTKGLPPTAEQPSGGQSRGRSFCPRAWKAIAVLFEKAWLWRIWTLPEIVLARSAILVCGSRSSLWDDFVLAYAAWREARVPRVIGHLSGECQKMLHWPDYAAGAIAIVLRHALRKGQREDFMSLIPRTLAFQCTDPRDRVYALLGLSEGGAIDIPVDYNKSLLQVYTDLVVALAAQDGNLSTLVHAGVGTRASGSLADMPSWIPDLGNISNSIDADAGFAAGTGKSARATPSVDSNVLSVQGVFVTSIDEVEEHDSHDALRRTRWVRMVLSQASVAHPTGLPQLQVYFRTLICDGNKRALRVEDFDFAVDATDFYALAVGFLYIVSHVEREDTTAATYSLKTSDDSEELNQADDNEEAVQSLSDYDEDVQSVNGDEDVPSFDDYVSLFAAWTGRTSPLLSDHEILSPFLGPAESPLRLHWPVGSEPHVGFDHRDAFSEALALRCWKSSFFISKSGYMGLCPPGTRKGDLVCVVLGSDMPLVLRPCKEGHQLVGRSYVYGVMHGEALEPTMRPARLRTFRLR
ncbi:ankyrin and HET domain-containing protein [Paraphaeosphaeria sporulosa]